VRFTRAELLAAAGAQPEELTALEQQRLVVPRRPWWRFGRRPAWYTDAHLDVLRRFVRGRRAVEANRWLRHGAPGP
jgi:hypothetical protein